MALPPTPNAPKPIQLGQWIANPLEYMHEYERQCGDIFSLRISGALDRAIFISNPHTIQQVLTNDTKQFAAPGSINQILQPFLGKKIWERGVRGESF